MASVNPPYYLSKLRPTGSAYDNYYTQLENVLFGLYQRSGGEQDAIEQTDNNESEALTNARLYEHEQQLKEIRNLTTEPNTDKALIISLLTKVDELEQLVWDQSVLLSRLSLLEQKLNEFEPSDETLMARMFELEQQIKDIKES